MPRASIVAGAGADPEAAEGDLEAGRALVVAHQPVAEGVAAPVGGPAVAHPEAGEPGPAAVLDRGERPGLEDLQHALHRCSTNRTRAPGVSRAGGSRVMSQVTSSVCPMSCQPPGDSRG